MSNKIFSFIVCTYNREKYLEDNLLHLINQDFIKDKYEIIIINNNSTDSTDSICRRIIKDYREIDIIYHVEKNLGLSYARNAGLQLATGSYVIFIDDDAFANGDYLKNLSSFIQSTPDFIAGGGKIIPVYETSKPKWMSEFLYPLVAATNLKDDVKTFPKGKFPLGANMIFKKSVMLNYGPFNINLGRKGEKLEGGEEKDIFNRIRKDGNITFYVSDAVVRHMIPDKRLTKEYIRNQAIGVGKSEKVRLQGAGTIEKSRKLISEGIKIVGSVVLFLYYAFTFRPAKGWILIKFRFWVLKGFIH